MVPLQQVVVTPPPPSAPIIFYNDEDRAYWTMNENGQNRQFLTHSQWNDAFSQDGQRIIYTHRVKPGLVWLNFSYPEAVAVIAVDGSWSLNLTDQPLLRSANDLKDSFDGQYISYMLYKSPTMSAVRELYTVHLQSGNRSLLATQRGIFAIWSPIEAKLAVRFPPREEVTDPLGGMYLMSVDGSEKKLLVAGDIVGAAWSPDGRFLALTLREQEPDEVERLYLLEVDSRTLIGLTTDGRYQYQWTHTPHWSPDSQKLLYLANVIRTEDAQAKVEKNVLFVYDLQMETHNWLTQIELYQATYLWSPDSQRVLYKAMDDKQWYITSIADWSASTLAQL